MEQNKKLLIDDTVVPAKGSDGKMRNVDLTAFADVFTFVHILQKPTTLH